MRAQLKPNRMAPCPGCGTMTSLPKGIETQPWFRNWQAQGPKGGWHVTFAAQGLPSTVIRGQTAQQVVRQIIFRCRNNGVDVTEEDIWAECNRQWLARVPKHRWLVEDPAPQEQAMWTPQDWGPMAWAWLHSFGARFEKQAWLMTIERILAMLDPVKSPRTGCDECHSHFVDILADRTHLSVETELEAARWTHRVHNLVNRRLQKPEILFEQAAKMHGWQVRSSAS